MAGGMDLAPISVELTYGLERIAMHLQGVDDVYDLAWAPGVSYREVRHREEIEQSKYAFGHVDLSASEFGRAHRDLFDRYYALGERLLASGLALPVARPLPEVLARLQPAGRERQHRRHPSAPPTSCVSGSWPSPSPRRTPSGSEADCPATGRARRRQTATQRTTVRRRAVCRSRRSGEA